MKQSHLLVIEDDPAVREASQVQRLKKFMNYVADGAEPTGEFLHQIRRVATLADFFHVCEQHLNHDRPLALEPSGSGATGRSG